MNMHARIHLRIATSAFPVSMEAGAILTIDGPFRREGATDFVADDAPEDRVMLAIAHLGLLLMRNPDAVSAFGVKVAFAGRGESERRLSAAERLALARLDGEQGLLFGDEEAAGPDRVAPGVSA